LRQGDVDLLRRSRSRGPAAPDRRPPDGPVAAPALAGVSSHPQQRAVSGGEEARAQDVSVERLAPAIRELVRAEIAAAHGREVSFVARPDANGVLVQARPVARGTVDAVLALPGIAERGELLLHNHPSGVLEPSGADLSVAARLHDGGVGFAIVDNAGTGVGKSFAYLAPALGWARENGERTIVSTNTINLQEQLVGKDLPILARALGTGDHSPTFALLKGWRNYICLARLEQARDAERSLFEDERAAELETLAAWAAKTSDGRSEEHTSEL